ncbi:MAG: EamA family transporter [Turicibacter sp.]|nr:EamA family transporter [Turicibacter sp.]
MGLWFYYAVGAAIFAALTTILAKIGLQDIDSHVATAARTFVVLIFAWIMVLIVDSQNNIATIATRTWVFLILSGLSTGASWLCYFYALKIGSVNKVVPIDKSSTIITMLLAFIFLSEPFGIYTAVGMLLMAVGTWLMLDLKQEKAKKTGQSWLVFALLSALFASLTAIFGSIGIADIEANLGTAIRTTVVLPLTFVMLFLTKGNKRIGNITKKSLFFLLISGIATGASWLLFYHALQLGNASQVVPIDKLSILFTMTFAAFFLKEKFSAKTLSGLALLTIGTLLPILLF